jgi:diguanylate cyclase (GGDEF)-like protein
MNETGPEISQSEAELVKQTTDTLQFQDRRKQVDQSHKDESTEVKQLLENYTAAHSSPPIDASKGIYLLNPNRNGSREQDDQSENEHRRPSWEQANLPDVNLDYDTFIGELIHQQNRILHEQGHNFGDIEVAKQLLFPTVLRHTTEYLAQQKEVKELEEEVYKDGLTELLNQKYFENRFSKVLEEEIESGRDLALLFIDTDNFKIMNDTLGHPYGDSILKIVASILHAEVRDLDLIIRKGGDEFAILLKNVASAKALDIAERIRAAAEQAPVPEVPEGKTKPALTFSIGVTTSETAKSAEEFKEQAEVSMYHSKRTEDGQDRKNAVTAYVPGMTMPKGGENGRSSVNEVAETE